MRIVIHLALLLLISAPAGAFVEQLHPHAQQTGTGGIPCHAIGAILRNYAEPGGPNAAALGNIMQREWVPGGWTEQDNTDNTALVNMLNGMPPPQREVKVQTIEDFCILWEQGVDELDTPEEYRARIGIAP